MFRFTVLLLAVAIASSSAQLPGSTPFSTAGTTEQAVSEFLGKLQKAIAADDRAAVSKLVDFPLRAWNGKATITVKDRKQLLAQYPAVFTASLKKTISAARLENSWANGQGVMFESGRLWLRPGTDGALHIVTINQPTN